MAFSIVNPESRITTVSSSIVHCDTQIVASHCRLPILFALLYSPLTQIANAERNRPADVQVDLVFPCNETYAQTQWFPVIFGVQNLDAVWPLDMVVDVTVRTNDLYSDDAPSWRFTKPYVGFTDLSPNASPPGKHLFRIRAINMTNGTTDSYNILWEAKLKNRCFAINTLPELDDGGAGWSNATNGLEVRLSEFSTALGAQLPDIEATIDSCPERNENTSTTVRVTEVRKTYGREYGDPCPVLDTNATATKCGYISVVKELAAKASAVMLGKMNCDSGAWQTITVPCAKDITVTELGFGSELGSRSGFCHFHCLILEIYYVHVPVAWLSVCD